MSDAMTKSEREALLKLCRQREKLAKADASVVASKRKADFEKQLAATYSFDDDVMWRKARAVAAEAVQEARRIVADRVQELGIPRQFAPDLDLHWFSRGENASRARRAELIRVAHAEIDHLEKEAKLQIEKVSVAIQTQLLAGSLESAAAKLFLEQMPTPEDLMPEIQVSDVETKLAARQPKLLN